MISFIIPLMSPQASADWDTTRRLFSRTLGSVLAQTDPSLRVVVVCHEAPSEPLLLDRRVVVEVVDFDLSLSPGDVPFHADARIEIGETDKGRKLMWGTRRALELGTGHLMFVDADDCVSRRLAGLANGQPECAGWKVECGYAYRDGADSLRLKPWAFHRQCGTGLILRQDLVSVPGSPRFDRGLRYYRSLLGHEHLADDLRRGGHRLRTVPFPGAVYTLHAANWRAHEFAAGLTRWKRAAGAVRGKLLQRPLTRRLQQEFQLFPATAAVLRGIPPDGQHAVSADQAGVVGP